MASLGNESGLNAFFRRETANETHHKTFGSSLGKEKIRCDLVDWIYDVEKVSPKKESLQIISNQFCVAMEEDHFVDEQGAKDKTGWFRVAVKVSDENSKIHQYAIFNLASLSKRLEVPEDELKRIEQTPKGLDAAYIKERLKLQIEKQEKLLENIKNYESTPSLNEKNLLCDKIESFINEEFAGDSSLQKKLSIWRSNKKLAENPKSRTKINQMTDDTFSSICRELKSKLWIAPTGDSHIKMAINKTNPLEGAYWATTGKDEERVLHLRSLSEKEDPNGKYSIDIKPFVYSSYPTPTSSKEVPLKLTNKKGWVLASVDSLKWLGITEDRIRELAKRHTDNRNSGMTQLDLEVMNQIHQISDQIREGQSIKQQLADAHPDPISNIMRQQRGKAVQLIDDIYDCITSPNVSKRAVSLEAIKKKCAETIKGGVGSENSVISTFLIAAHHCEDQKLGAVWNWLKVLVNEKFNGLPYKYQSLLKIQENLSDLDQLKLMTSLDSIIAGRILKAKCNAFENNIKSARGSAELRNIQFLNKNIEFTDTAKKFVDSILMTITGRKTNKKSNFFNANTFKVFISLAEKILKSDVNMATVNDKNLIKVAIKAAILEAAKNYSDEELGIIKEWFESEDFEKWITEQKNVEYIRQGPLEEDVFTEFKRNIEKISKTKSFKLEDFPEDFDEIDSSNIL